MKQYHRVIIAAAVSVYAWGCVDLSVKKVSQRDGTAGQRIYLPKPFLAAEPQPNGTVLVTDVYFADPNHCYAVQASTFSAAFTLKIERSNGIITKVNFNPDTTGVIDKAIDATAQIGAKISDQRAKDDAAAHDAAEAKRKADKDATAALKKAFSDAASTVIGLARDIDMLNLDLAAFQGDAAKAKETQLAIDKKKKARDFALADLNSLRTKNGLPTVTLDDVLVGKGDDISGLKSGVALVDEPAAPTTRPFRAVGPVFYAIDESIGENGRPVVKLRPVTFDSGASAGPAYQAEIKTVDLGTPPGTPSRQSPAAPKLLITTVDDSTLGKVFAVQHPDGNLTGADITQMTFYTEDNFTKPVPGQIADKLKNIVHLGAASGGGGLRIEITPIDNAQVKAIEIRGARCIIPKPNERQP